MFREEPRGNCHVSIGEEEAEGRHHRSTPGISCSKKGVGLSSWVTSDRT